MFDPYHHDPPTLAAFSIDPRDKSQDIYRSVPPDRNIDEVVQHAPHGTISITFFNPNTTSLLGAAARDNASQVYFIGAYVADGVVHLPNGQFLAYDPARHVIIEADGFFT